MADEQLFILEPAFLTENYVINTDSAVKDNSTRYCVCEDQASSTEPLEDFFTVHCNLTESTEYCSGTSDTTDNVINAFYTTCVRSTRKRRSIDSKHNLFRRNPNDGDDVVDFKPLSYDDSVNQTETLVIFINVSYSLDVTNCSVKFCLPLSCLTSFFNDFVSIFWNLHNTGP